AARREALKVINDRDVIHRLFAEVAPRYSARDGGYTRILKLGTRQGDKASMVILELV
ncbi:MAG TPA: 50S ribosomal protein L17, partial [Candidatus Limnocylindrales bacterium]